MRKINIVFVAVVVTAFANPFFVFASEVVLKSGQKIEGKIMEQTDKYVKIEDSNVGVPMTYYTDEIETIDGNPVTLQKPVATQEKQTTGSSEVALPQTLPTQPSEAESNQMSVYQERLVKFLQNTKSKSPEAIQDFQNLLNFEKEYPQSAYVPDVEFIYLWSVPTPPHKAPLDKWKNLVNAYPNGVVSELTRDSFKNYLFEVPDMSIIFSKYLAFVKGNNAFWIDKDYQEAILEYGEYIKGLNLTDAVQKKASFGAYLFSLVSYINLKQKDHFDKLKAEAISVFTPGSDEYSHLNELQFS